MRANGSQIGLPRCASSTFCMASRLRVIMFRDQMPTAFDGRRLLSPDFPGFSQITLLRRGTHRYRIDNAAEVSAAAPFALALAQTARGMMRVFPRLGVYQGARANDGPWSNRRVAAPALGERQ